MELFKENYKIKTTLFLYKKIIEKICKLCNNTIYSENKSRTTQDIVFGRRRMIKVFGKEDCSKCETLKKILDDKGLEYEYTQDLKTLMIVASKARIMSAPVVEKDGKYYSMESFLEVL